MNKKLYKRKMKSEESPIPIIDIILVYDLSYAESYMQVVALMFMHRYSFWVF